MSSIYIKLRQVNEWILYCFNFSCRSVHLSGKYCHNHYFIILMLFVFLKQHTAVKYLQLIHKIHLFI